MGALAGCAQPIAFSGSMGSIEGSRPVIEQVAAPEQEQEIAPALAQIGVETTLSQDGFEAEGRSEFIARVRVRPEKLEGLPKPPVSVALVLDTSGSMAGEPIEEAKAAALDFIDALDDDDRVSLVVFHSVAETLVPLRDLGDGGRALVREALEGVRAEGTTDLLGGLSSGSAQLQPVVAGGGVGRVVLLSDGQPNDATNLLPVADQIASRGITVTALGLGLEYDEDLLGKIAQRTGGKFHFAESPDQVATLFRDEVLALERVVGRSASLTLLPGPGVEIERVLGPAQSAARSASVQLGDLTELRERDVFVLLSSSGHTAGATIEVLDAHLSFYDPIAKQHRTARSFASTLAVESADDISGNAEVERMAARALAADEALAALTLARSGKLAAAKKRVAIAIARAKRDAARFDDDVLRKKVEDLVEVRRVLPEVTPPRVRRPRRMAVGGGRPPAEPPRPAPVGGLGAKRSHAAAMAGLGY